MGLTAPRGQDRLFSTQIRRTSRSPRAAQAPAEVQSRAEDGLPRPEIPHSIELCTHDARQARYQSRDDRERRRIRIRVRLSGDAIAVASLVPRRQDVNGFWLRDGDSPARLESPGRS